MCAYIFYNNESKYSEQYTSQGFVIFKWCKLMMRCLIWLKLNFRCDKLITISNGRKGFIHYSRILNYLVMQVSQDYTNGSFGVSLIKIAGMHRVYSSCSECHYLSRRCFRYLWHITFSQEKKINNHISLGSE